MRLGYIIIYVKDIQETVAFYEKAFGLKYRSIHESVLMLKWKQEPQH